MSNGGFMSHMIGCEAADMFAAVAPVAGKVGIPNCQPSRPMPVMAFHGTADPLVGYDTGALSGETPPATEPEPFSTGPTATAASRARTRHSRTAP